jgi:glycerate 2-kinase
MDKSDNLKELAKEIFNEALRAADPVEATHRHFRVKSNVIFAGGIDYFCDRFKRIYAVGAGKASAKMARAIEESLGDKLTGGLVIVKKGGLERLNKVEVREAGHPVPDRAGLEATTALMGLVSRLDKDDLVINLISGGGSALLTAPADGVPFEDKQAATELMLKAGMKIDGTNAVRKHLSKVKGGRLAKLAYPATLISLVLSDVIGDKLEVIASGPTVADPSTFAEALEWLKRYDLQDKVPALVRSHLEMGVKGRVEETPKPSDPVFKKSQDLVVGSNRLSLEAAEACARKRGLNTLLLTSSIQGEASTLAKFYASILSEILSGGRPVSRPACIIIGGEPTVTVRGNGKGGRSQELALAMAMEIEGLEGAMGLFAGTDGTDGPTDAAGAFADWQTIGRARALNLDARDFLDRNDSFHFFSKLSDLFVTGPTGTNVMDVHILIVD